MNKGRICISSCVAVGVLLFTSFVDKAHAACIPPFDVSSCTVIPTALFAQPSPALPEPPFLVTDPGTRDTPVLVMTQFDREPKPAAPGENSCGPSNVGGCSSVPSVDLADRVTVQKKTIPFLVQFQDGRSLLASPMP